MGDISTDLKQNEKRVREMIEGCDDILFRPMKLGKNKEISCFLIYIEVAAGNMMLEDSVIGKMLNHMWEMDESGIQKAIEENSLEQLLEDNQIQKSWFLWTKLWRQCWRAMWYYL